MVSIVLSVDADNAASTEVADAVAPVVESSTMVAAIPRLTLTSAMELMIRVTCPTGPSRPVPTTTMIRRMPNDETFLANRETEHKNLQTRYQQKSHFDLLLLAPFGACMLT